MGATGEGRRGTSGEWRVTNGEFLENPGSYALLRVFVIKKFHSLFALNLLLAATRRLRLSSMAFSICLKSLSNGTSFNAFVIRH